MYLYIIDRGGSSKNAQRSNFNKNKKSMTVTVMTVDVARVNFPLLQIKTTHICHYFHEHSSL